MFYRGCLIIKKEEGYLVITPARKKFLFRDAKCEKDCENWIDRQLANFAIYKVFTE